MNKHVKTITPETIRSQPPLLPGRHRRHRPRARLCRRARHRRGARRAPANFEPSVWYAIAPDGLVTVTCGKADMGQHIASTMAQIVCEELGAKWSDMRVQLASNDPKFNDPVLGAQITGGSWSTMMNFDAMSRAGAAGRMALTEGAPPRWACRRRELVVRDSMIAHPKSKKQMSFADVVKSGKATKTFTPDELKAIKLKTPDQYTMIGVSVPQLDIPSKTNGTAKYGIDVMLPGMVYGAVVTPPVRFGATVKSVDDSAAKKVPGFIKAVTLDDKTADDDRLGRRGRQHLCQRQEGGGRR